MLLQRNDIKKKIAAISKYNESMLYSSVISALKSIIFNSNSSGQAAINTDALTPELSQCAQIKIPKDGQLELKFIDKLKAIELLIQLMNQQPHEENPNDFYTALCKSVDSTINEEVEQNGV